MKQSKQDRAALGAWGSRGVTRLWWLMIARWHSDRHIPLWPAIVVVCVVVVAIIARGM